MYAAERLVADPALVARLAESLAAGGDPPQLRDAKLKVTSRCNLACQMCDYWRTTTEQTLTLDAWCGLLDQLAELGCRKVHLSGGEPFLRRDLLEILAHGVASGLKVNLTTNGTLVSEAAVKRLVGMGVNAISISLDGPKAKLHDAIRGRAGAFKITTRTIRRLVREARRKKARTKVRINFVIMRENFRRLPDMVRLAGELGAVDLVPMPVDGPDRLSRRQLEEFNAEVAPAAADARRELGFPLTPDRLFPFGTSAADLAFAKLGRYARGQFERQPCYAPWLHTFVAWNGDVFLCCMTNATMKPLGNVRKTPLRDVLTGERYRQVRADFLARRLLPDCHRCDLFPKENALIHQALAALRPPPRRLIVVDARAEPM